MANKRIEEALTAFVAGRDNNGVNDKVLPTSISSIWKLHGNQIARRYRDDNDNLTLEISHCGWPTNTTKARLNAILARFKLGRISQISGEWYIVTTGPLHKFTGRQVFENVQY